MNRSSERTVPSKIAVILLGVMMIMCMTGCGKPKYKLTFGSDGFKSEKKEYAEGEKVTVYYDIIATDTDYSFYTDCDDVKLKQDWDNNHGYIFTFSMPSHDVKISVTSRNSMEFIPDTSPDVPFTDSVPSDDNLSTDTWFCPECGQKNDMLYCKDCGLKKPD